MSVRLASGWPCVGVHEEELEVHRDSSDSLVDPTRWPGAPLEERRSLVHARAEELIAHGATRRRVLSEEGVDHHADVLQDPEGNEFCVN